MIKYVITKEIEIDEYYFESDVVGVFDAEQTAKQAAERMFEEMPDHEKQFYEIIVWEIPEESLEEEGDWGTFTSGESVAFFTTVERKSEDELLEELCSENYCALDDYVHFCVAPLQDGMRLWVGDDPNKYVDRVLVGLPGETAMALEEWFKQYGEFKEESWNECFPETNRKYYIRRIISRGKSYEEALEILRYLPQTVSILAEENVSKMIELWENKAKIIEPYRMPLWKKKVLQGDPDIWEEDIRSPRAERSYKEGWLKGRSELVKTMSEENGMTYQEVMEILKVSEEDQKEILELING